MSDKVVFIFIEHILESIKDINAFILKKDVQIYLQIVVQKKRYKNKNEI